MRTALAFQPNICAKADNCPLIGAAGMWFSQTQVVVHLQVGEHGKDYTFLDCGRWTVDRLRVRQKFVDGLLLAGFSSPLKRISTNCLPRTNLDGLKTTTINAKARSRKGFFEKTCFKLQSKFEGSHRLPSTVYRPSSALEKYFPPVVRKLSLKKSPLQT